MGGGIYKVAVFIAWYLAWNGPVTGIFSGPLQWSVDKIKSCMKRCCRGTDQTPLLRDSADHSYGGTGEQA